MSVSIKQYWLKHWQGAYPLAFSFWFNFVLISVLISVGEAFMPALFSESQHFFLLAIVIYFVIFRLIVFPWQVVGLLRASDHYLAQSGEVVWVRAAQAVIVIECLVIVISALGALQNYLAMGKQQPIIVKPDPAYSLTLLKNNSLLHVKGLFDVGITREVAVILDQYPSIAGIILDSDGGRIYEGRGLAKLIQDHRLPTYVLTACKSACVTAFISGSKRTLAPQAQLGFHQYWLDSNILHPFIDIQVEQDKDRAFFQQQQVSAEFLSRIFDTSHSAIWLPASAELLEAGVVHQIVDDALW